VIERLFIKDFLLFKRVELEFKSGLVVFSGASGSGKSLLIEAILYAFGYCTTKAKLVELNIKKPPNLRSEFYELDEEIVLKVIRKDKARYYIDGQSISKRAIFEMFSPYLKYLSIRDKLLFSNHELLELLDRFIGAQNREYLALLKEYKRRFRVYKQKLAELEKIRADEVRLDELIEFTKFEIKRIEEINPKEGEDIELLEIKQRLSRLDKLESAIGEARAIFEYEGAVCEVYRLLNRDDTKFLDAMEQLREDFREAESLFEELSEIDIEYVLNRLEKLSFLKHRYGGIREALEYANRKRQELISYQNIEQNREKLDSFISKERLELISLAEQISDIRKRYSRLLEKELLGYLFELKLPAVKFIFDTISIDEFGLDRLNLDLNGSTIDTLSGGEFNRIRLALMVASLSNGSSSGIIILDEIDANVSGDESIAIANMISKLSKVFQIFAISHQAHLASKADQHILITKQDSISSATILDREGKIAEIARIIGGERPNREAIGFAKKLVDIKESGA